MGGTRGRVILSIFRRPLAQVRLGAIFGAVLVAAMMIPLYGVISVEQVVVTLAYIMVMIGVCMLACAPPARRALHIQPTEALKTEV